MFRIWSGATFTCRSFVFTIHTHLCYTNSWWGFPVNIMVWKLIQNRAYFFVQGILDAFSQWALPRARVMDRLASLSCSIFLSDSHVCPSVKPDDCSLSCMWHVKCHLPRLCPSWVQLYLGSKIELGLKSPIPMARSARRRATAQDNLSLRHAKIITKKIATDITDIKQWLMWFYNWFLYWPWPVFCLFVFQAALVTSWWHTVCFML